MIKSKIFKTTPTSIEFIEGIRSPIRLGTDVFNNGCLAKEKLDLLVKTLKKYQKNFIKNDIEDLSPIFFPGGNIGDLADSSCDRHAKRAAQEYANSWSQQLGSRGSRRDNTGEHQSPPG